MTNTWHLVRIESHDGQYAINLEYQLEDYTYKIKPGRRHFRGVYVGPSASGSINELPSTNAFDQIRVKSKKISKINSLFETIDFAANTTRNDLALNTKQLDHIKITKGSFQKQWTFNYDYFTDPGHANTYEGNRLRLLSVGLESLTSTDQTGRYSFDYIKDDNGQYFLPTTLSQATDYWGFYNGAMLNDNFSLNIPTMTVNGFTCTGCGSDRTTDEQAMMIGTLNKMTHPHGGATFFTYEANRYQPTADHPFLPPLTTAVIQQFGPTLQNCAISYPNNACCGTQTDATTTNISLTNDQLQTGYVRLKLRKKVNNNDGCAWPITDAFINMVIRDETDPQNPQVAYATGFNINQEIGDAQQNGDPEVEQIVNLSFDGDLDLSADVPYSLEIEVHEAYGELRLYESVYPTDTPDGQYIIGGLRLKESRVSESNSDAAVAADIIKTYSYSPGTLFEEYPGLGIPINYSFSCESAGNDCTQSSATVNGALFFDSPLNAMSDLSGYHIGYHTVTEWHNGNGRREMIFELEDVPFPYFSTSGFPGNRPQAILVNNGKILQVNQYEEGQSNPIQQQIRFPRQESYQTPITTPVGDIFKSSELSFSGNDGQYGALFFLDYVNQTKYYRLDTIINTLDKVTTLTSYEYHPGDIYSLPISESMTNSDGKKFTTQTTYSFDQSSPLYDEMQQRNMRLPVEQLQLVDGVVVDGSRTNYSFFDAAGNPTATANASFPIYLHTAARNEKTWDNGSLTPDNWRTKIDIEQYDVGQGRPAVVHQEGWQPELYSWDDGRLVNRTFCANYDMNSGDCVGNDFFEWTYDYFPGTALIRKTTDLDGQFIDYTYDGLCRLKTTTARLGNVTTTFDYHFKGINGASDNYVRSRTDFTPVGNSALTNLETYQYIDGLGRPVQTIQKQYAPNGEDVAIVQNYDNQGRAVQASDPFATGRNDGSRLANPTAYNPQWTTTRYEASPLNRPIGLTPPGWYETTTTYSSNTDGEIAGYGADVFAKVTVQDPNGNQTTTYIDRRGRQMLVKRTDTSGNNPVSTFKFYDDKDRLSLVIPPNGSLFTPSLQYQYQYDGEDRLIYKKIPDAEPIRYAYNERDLLTAVQDGLQQTHSRWLITKYDAYGRPVQTGFYNNLQLPATTTFLDNPTINDLLTESFYDGNADVGNEQITDAIYKGKVRKSKVRILDENGVSDTWLSQLMSYDPHGRMTQSTGNNHLEPNNGNSQVLEQSYDFADHLLDQQSQVLGYQQQTIDHTFHYYDAKGRLIQKQHNLNFAAQNEILCALQYDQEDQLIQKQLGGIPSGGFLQTCDYTYNAQGWLTTINPNMQTNDLFQLNLFYDTPNTLLDAPAQKNGNIAAISWQTQGSEQRAYGFQYDHLDRLLKATYGDASGGSLAKTDQYSSSYTYDAVGNILTLTRQGSYNTGDAWVNAEIDNMTYDYFPNTNQIRDITDTGISNSNAGANCDPNPINITTPITADEEHHSQTQININTSVSGQIQVDFKAGERIEFNPGTVLDPDGTGQITAAIEGCLEGIGYNDQSTQDHLYDANGNLTRDADKQATISYNYLNLPYKVVFDKGGMIEWLYDANGTKLTKTVIQDTETVYTKDYLGNVEYQGQNMEAIYHEDGRVVPTPDGSSRYEYTLKDHLGNTRVRFADEDGDEVAEVIQENHYYAFGMTIARLGVSSGSHSRYLYNGKELNEELGLNWMDYGARWYDAAKSRFTSVDPLAESFSYQSTFAYAGNNPVVNIDILGMAAASTQELVDKAWAQGEGTYDNNGNRIEESQKNPLLPILKGAFGAAVDYFLQGTVNYISGMDMNDAFDPSNVNLWDVGVSGLQGALPWTVPGGKYGKAAAVALSDVLLNYGEASLSGKVYTKQQIIQDFLIGFTSQLGAEGIDDLINTRKVGRWMSDVEFKDMKRTKQVQEGGGGVTFISTNGKKILNHKLSAEMFM